MKGVVTVNEGHLATAFVSFADTLTSEFDLVDFLHSVCNAFVELFDVESTGLLLASPLGALRFVAASDEQMRVLELYQLQADKGPCLDCFRTGELVQETHPPAIRTRWPVVGDQITTAGFASTYAFPMRWQDQVIGTLNAFSTHANPLGEQELRVAQALADVATIGILHERNAREAHALADQLQTAFTTRTVIEQAKGILAQQGQTGMATAFALLRNTARSTNTLLRDIAQQVIDGTVSYQTLANGDGTSGSATD